jgi:hypothetical protein
LWGLSTSRSTSTIISKVCTTELRLCSGLTWPFLRIEAVVPRFLDSLAPSWGARHENKLEA